MVIEVGEGLLLILHLCLNVSAVYSKSTYNVAEFITPKKLLYLQYTIIYIFNIGLFSKNASFSSYLNICCLFQIGSHGHTHFMKYYDYNCHMIIILYTSSDYNNTLYYMLLDRAQTRTDGLITEIYLTRIVTRTSYDSHHIISSLVFPSGQFGQPHLTISCHFIVITPNDHLQCGWMWLSVNILLCHYLMMKL